jgi:hypothetical protein
MVPKFVITNIIERFNVMIIKTCTFETKINKNLTIYIIIHQL